MLIALDENDNRVHIKNAENYYNYYCPICGEKLLLKRGDVRVHHFSHRSNSKCFDRWHYDMSEWHSKWQEQFPMSSREIVFEKYGEKHRADIFINNTIIEFQHSNLSPNEFKERNNFYLSLGYKVIWIFDMIEDYYYENIYRIGELNSNHYIWNNPKNTFFNYMEDENLSIYFQIYENTWNYNKYYLFDKKFYNYGGTLLKVKKHRLFNNMENLEVSEKIDDIDFLRKFLNINKNVRIQINDKTGELIKYDQIICDNIFVSGVHDFGCCNYYVYCLMKNKFCKNYNCHDCWYLNSTHDKCIYRFAEIFKHKIDELIKIEKDTNGIVKKLYFKIEGKKVYIEFPQLPSTVDTIPNLWNNIFDITVAGFLNIKSGMSVKVSDVSKMVNKYNGKCYGRIKMDNDEYSYESKEIKHSNDPVWILEWYKKS